MIIDCASIAGALDEEIMAAVQQLRQNNIIPRMCEILATKNQGTISYSNTKKRKAERLGIEYQAIIFDDNVSLEEILNVIGRLNIDNRVHGIVIGMPTCPHINSEQLLSAIVPEKDVDGLGERNSYLISSNQEHAGIAPATAISVIHILEKHSSLGGKNVTVLGRGPTVGRPVAAMLSNRNATVTVCHSRTPASRVEAAVRESDIVIAATGIPGLLRSEWFGPNQIVVDCGIAFVDGKTTGDVISEEVSARGATVTPVPKGVGLVTNSMIFGNLLQAIQANSKAKTNHLASLAGATVVELFDAAASTNPTPGGGCISAIGGYLGISLLLKAIRISARKQADCELYTEIELKLIDVAPRLLQYAVADSESFEAYIAALRRPKSTDAERAARKQALKEASIAASIVGLDILDLGNTVLAYANQVQPLVLPTIMADVQACTEFMIAMNAVARENAHANLSGIDGAEDLIHRLNEAFAKTGRYKDIS